MRVTLFPIATFVLMKVNFIFIPFVYLIFSISCLYTHGLNLVCAQFLDVTPPQQGNP